MHGALAVTQVQNPSDHQSLSHDPSFAGMANGSHQLFAVVVHLYHCVLSWEAG
jgi:hypothetical protein